MQRHAAYSLGLILGLATVANARPLYIPELRCRGTHPVIVDGIMSDEAYGCRVARDPEASPEPTPAPTPNICAGKELPPVGDGEFGYRMIAIDDGATQTYCFTIPVGRVALDVDTYDRTPSQCFWGTLKVTLPNGTPLATSFGTTGHVAYFLSGQPIPAGSYRISVTARSDSGCVQRYGLSARSR